MADSVIWLIDENENQSRTYARRLQRALPQSIVVNRLFPPFSEISDNAKLLADPSTVCIVVDQKLKDTGIANYTGIELAQYLRGINAKIPIYILTNFPELHDEYESGEWSVEDIIDKNIFGSPQRIETLITRLLRHIDVYTDIANARIARFKELLQKKVIGERLTAEEDEEFTNLQFERIAPSEATGPHPPFDEISELLKQNQLILDRLDSLSDAEGE